MKAICHFAPTLQELVLVNGNPEESISANFPIGSLNTFRHLTTLNAAATMMI